VLVINPHLYTSMSVDPLKDLQPIAQVAVVQQGCERADDEEFPSADGLDGLVVRHLPASLGNGGMGAVCEASPSNLVSSFDAPPLCITGGATNWDRRLATARKVQRSKT